MTTEHPITPPPELVQEWSTEGRHQDYCTLTESVAARAAQWGADMELEACCEWISNPDTMYLGPSDLRAARRPKQPSLKEQALEELRQFPIDPEGGITHSALDTIRRALEALPDD